MSPSLQTMGFFMSDINFCNTKEQLNHLGEVVTGKVDGSPTGADIDTSTLPYTGQVRKTLPALEAEAESTIASYKLKDLGPYAPGILIPDSFSFVQYGGKDWFAINSPYTTTATSPNNDSNMKAGAFATMTYVKEVQEGTKNYVDAENSAQDVRISTNESEISALKLGQGSGMVAYATQAELFADLNHPENTGGLVTNDPTSTNNTNYLKLGGSGSGSWQKGDDTLSSQAYQLATDHDPKIADNTAQNLKATNKVINGGFSSGLSPWSAVRFASYNTDNDYFHGVSDGTASDSYIQQATNIPQGSEVFLSIRVRTSVSVEFIAKVQGFTLTTQTEANEWKTVSGNGVATSSDLRSFFRFTHGGDTALTVDIDSVVILNVGDVFGVGNCPDALDMESLLSKFPDSHFDGEVTLVGAKDSLGLFNVNKTSRLNVTRALPLLSGYYNRSTAREAVPESRRQLGLKITYQVSGNKWAEDQFVGSSLDGWEVSSNWLSTAQKIESTGISDSNGIKDGFDAIPLNKYIDGVYQTGTFYIEAVFMPLKRHDPEITYLFSDGSSSGVWIRRRSDAQYDFALYGASSGRVILTSIQPQGLPVHFILSVHNNELKLYVNGVIAESATLGGGVTETNNYDLNFIESTSLFRVGGTEITDEEALSRYNGGRPLSAIVNDAIVDIKTDGITKASIRENVSGEYWDYDSGVEIPAMYPDEIVGQGVPNFIPQFKRQKYHDTLVSTDYVAEGNGQVSDWKSITTSTVSEQKQATLVSGVNIKTINNVSILGAGNLTVGDGSVSVESKAFEFVTDYMGVADATTAAENALAAAAISGNPVLFTKGDYEIIRGLKLTSNVDIIATGGARLIRPIPVTQDIVQDMVIGQTFVEVQDASAFTVGCEIYILEPEFGFGGLTYGVINNISGNRLDFTPTDGQSGSVANYQVSAGIKVTTAISMVRTDPSVDTVNNVIDGLEFVTNYQPTDPLYYFCAIVHFNAASEKTTVKNCIINGSGADGISLQGRGDMTYWNNVINDVAHNAMHFGTTCTEILIAWNKVNRAGRNGVFFCFNNDRVIVKNNHFTDCLWGLAEIDNQDDLGDRDSIISDNTFENCTLGLGFNGGHDFNVNGNIFTKMQGTAKAIRVYDGAEGINISNNVVSKFDGNYNGNVIEIDNASDCNLQGNIIKDAVGVGTAIKLNNAVGLVVTGNNVSGTIANGATIDDVTDSIVRTNRLKATTPITETGTNTGSDIGGNVLT